MSLPLFLRKKSRLRSRKNNYRLRSVIFTSLDYQLFSVKRFSLCSKRKRSKLLFEKNVRLRASFLCLTFYMRLRRASERANILRTPAKGGSAFICHCPSSSEKSHVVAPVKITIACARLFLLRSTTNFFRQSVPLFGRNAGARGFCLRKTRSFGFFYAFLQ